MFVKRCVIDCFDHLNQYEERVRSGSTESTRNILSVFKRALIDVLDFIDPEANSQLGMAMDLMEIPLEQIPQNYPREMIPWCEAAWILLRTVHNIHEYNINPPRQSALIEGIKHNIWNLKG